MTDFKTNFLERGNPEVCESILRSLPDWFGIEDSTYAYIKKSQELPMIVAQVNEQPAGFLSLKHHGEFTSEIYVMGVLPSHHRSGIGKILLAEAEKYLAQRDFYYFQVKTLSPDRECEFYKKTRLFYEASGFKKVEVFPTLWDKANPCLLLIKNIDKMSAEANKIIIHKYREDWPKQFKNFKTLIAPYLEGLAISVDHIGSTSVPGLSAKNIIDVQITVKEINDDLQHKLDEELQGAGFGKTMKNVDHRPPGNDSPDDHWKKLYLRGVHPQLDFRANVHIRALGSDNQKYPLLFRDFLRTHPESMRGYEYLKRELSRYHPYDIIAYCEIKDPGCDLIMAHANEWAKETNWTADSSMEGLK